MSSRDAEERWPILEWWELAERLARQTFQVLRHNSCGTAFLVCQGLEQESSLSHYIFATAWHVIEDLLEEEEFILFRHADRLAIKGVTERIMTARLGPPEFDLGFLIMRTADDVLDVNHMMPVRGLKTFPSLGEDLGWYGYPGSLGYDPLFCRGTLACFKTDPHCYLINGVAYPGMSGGGIADQRGWIVGIVSKWWQDPALREAPGLLQAAPSAMVRHVLEDRLRARVIEP